MVFHPPDNFANEATVETPIDGLECRYLVIYQYIRGIYIRNSQNM